MLPKITVKKLVFTGIIVYEQNVLNIYCTLRLYSNHAEWGEYVFHGDYTACSQPAKAGWPLWYADYDGAQNFNDFEAFGGWTKPVAKQYAGDKTVCGQDVDLNWEPSAVRHNEMRKSHRHQRHGNDPHILQKFALSTCPIMRCSNLYKQ